MRNVPTLLRPYKVLMAQEGNLEERNNQSKTNYATAKEKTLRVLKRNYEELLGRINGLLFFHCILSKERSHLM
jgi:hypothetical protein